MASTLHDYLPRFPLGSDTAPQCTLTYQYNCICVCNKLHAHIVLIFVCPTEKVVFKGEEVSVSTKLTVNGKLFVLPKNSPKKMVRIHT